MTADTTRWLLAAAAATLIAAMGIRARALSFSGGIAAIVVGTVVVGGGGWWSGLLLVLFFVTSSGLSLVRKRRVTRRPEQRGSRRDAVQVVANGGVAALCGLAAIGPAGDAWLLALATSLAVANADTWATEIGRMSGRTPRAITTGRPVPSGASGGISLPGTTGACAGALLIAAAAVIGQSTGVFCTTDAATPTLALVTICGFLGCLIDSLLGATVQALYRCPRDGELTEAPHHECGTQAELVRGYRWITNDVVNVSSIALASLLALVTHASF